MELNLVAFLTFVIITTFTPGPNNIASASLGIIHGYKRCLKFLLGIVTGFCAVLIVSGLISSTLMTLFPNVEKIVRILGALYILWLAWHTFKANYTFNEEDAELQEPVFLQGLFLTLLNPKSIVYSLTIYTTFLSGIVHQPGLILLSAFGLTAVCFTAISTWALMGTAIRSSLKNVKLKQALNTMMAIALVYTAVDLSGLLKLLHH